MLFFGRAVPANVWQERGNNWQPHLHVRGPCKGNSVLAITTLVDKYQLAVVAFRIQEVVGGTYSIELQFGRNDKEQASKRSCQAVYEKWPKRIREKNIDRVLQMIVDAEPWRFSKRQSDERRQDERVQDNGKGQMEGPALHYGNPMAIATLRS